MDQRYLSLIRDVQAAGKTGPNPPAPPASFESQDAAQEKFLENRHKINAGVDFPDDPWLYHFTFQLWQRFNVPDFILKQAAHMSHEFGQSKPKNGACESSANNI